MRNLEEFNGVHKGKTAFVVGSGPSTGMLDLEPLRDYVTIAVNSGYVAVPFSDYFITDDWSVANWSYFFKDLKESESTIALLYEDMLKNQSAQFNDRAVLFRHRLGYHITDKYEHNNRKNHICQARTSSGSAIHVAHIMGCDKIVLIGVDCCRSESVRHFWGKRGAVSDRPYRSDKFPVDPYRRITDSDVQTDTDLMDILAYWKKQAHHFNKCGVLNASPISVLEMFPKINLQEFISNNQEGKRDV